MTSDVWHALEGVDLNAATTFPVRARLGETGIFIFRTKDGYRGTERACPHLKSSLADAILMAGDTVIRCSHHNFTFKLSNGKGINGPSYKLRVFDIRVEDGVAYARAAT
jgi:nitrite reductase/ring-hydroxylating ferredoxin subunit